MQTNVMLGLLNIKFNILVAVIGVVVSVIITSLSRDPVNTSFSSALPPFSDTLTNSDANPTATPTK